MRLSNNAGRFLAVATLLGVLVAFFSKSPDVRLTMCQDLTRLLLHSPAELQWNTHNPVIKGYEDFEMQIDFSITDSNGQTRNAQASCFYEYVEDDIGAETFQMPASAYSTYPNKMLLEGKVVDKQLLADSVNQVMIQQGKEVIQNLKEKIK